MQAIPIQSDYNPTLLAHHISVLKQTTACARLPIAASVYAMNFA